MIDSQQIVFYGTLTSNNQTSVHDEISQKLTFDRSCTVMGSIYDMGRYPAYKKDGDNKISCELYSIDDRSILHTLDMYELLDNEDPTLPGFSRKLIPLDDSNSFAWIYEYDGSVINSKKIYSGSWHEWIQRK